MRWVILLSSLEVIHHLFYRNDTEEAGRLQVKINELEERAKELDKLRTSTISSISYINDRNRKKNVEEAEKAILVSS